MQTWCCSVRSAADSASRAGQARGTETQERRRMRRYLRTQMCCVPMVKLHEDDRRLYQMHFRDTMPYLLIKKKQIYIGDNLECGASPGLQDGNILDTVHVVSAVVHVYLVAGSVQDCWEPLGSVSRTEGRAPLEACPPQQPEAAHRVPWPRPLPGRMPRPPTGPRRSSATPAHQAIEHPCCWVIAARAWM